MAVVQRCLCRALPHHHQRSHVRCRQEVWIFSLCLSQSILVPVACGYVLNLSGVDVAGDLSWSCLFCRYAKLIDQTELENSFLSKHELRHQEDL